jgi:diaminobutyrate-2-oxoglutarate transaminase
MPFDGYFGEGVDTIAHLDKVLSDPSSGMETPAAVILETLQGEGGLNVARIDWLQRLQALCNKRGIVLIVDDIQAGCGRTGTFFSFEPAGLTPDVITLSKSLSGYGLPLALVVLKRSLDKWRPGEHNGTFRGNNHAFVTATAAIEQYWSTPDFAADVRAKGDYIAQRLQAMADRFPADILDVRGRGMMIGMRCADPKRAAAITAQAYQYGLIIERAGPDDEVIKCMMPLTTTRAELAEGLDMLERAVIKEFGTVEVEQTFLGHRQNDERAPSVAPQGDDLVDAPWRRPTVDDQSGQDAGSARSDSVRYCIANGL